MFDEVGRGTSPLDGLALSYSVLEHLVTINCSRTLFATHFHELARLMKYDDTALSRLDFASTVRVQHGWSTAKDPGAELVRGRGTGIWKGVEFWCSDVDQDSVRDLLLYSRATSL